MKKLTFMIAMLFMAVASFAQDAVVLPDGLTAEEFVFSGTHVTTGIQKTPATVNVAVDGSDVYMQGLAYGYPEGWAKGTLDGNVVTFAANQLMGESSEGNVFFCPDYDVTFTYDAEAETYTSAKYEIKTVSGWEVYRDITLSKPVAVDPFTTIVITPADGSEVEQIENFTVSFPEHPEISSNFFAEVTLTNLDTNDSYTGQIYDDGTGYFTIAFDPAVTTPGSYELKIGAGAFDNYEADTQSPEYVYHYTIAAPIVFGWTINPEEGKVESLTNIFEIQFENGKVTYDYTQADPTLTKDGENLVDFMSMNVSASQKATLYFGSMSETTYTEDGTYVLTIPAGTLKNNGEAMEELTFTWTIGEAGEEPGGEEPAVDELVQLPAGVTAEEYQYKSVKPAESIYPAEDITATVQVAFDGNDVYVQGLSRDYADGWVKGVRNGETITFAKKQYVGLYEQSILGTVVASYKVYFSAENDVVFTYDEANNKLTTDAYVINELMADGGYTTTENYTAVEIFKEGGEQPGDEPGDGVTPPATAEQKEYTFEATDTYYSSKTYERTVKVAVDGTDVYFQGLAECMPEAWVKGTVAEGNVTITMNTLMGKVTEDGTEREVYLNPEADLVFAYNAETDEYTTAKYEVVRGYFYENYSNVRIYIPEEKPFDVMDYVAIDPEEGEIDAIGAFTVTFGDYAVAKANPTAVASLKNNTTEEENFAPVLVVANKKVMLSYEESTTAGEYTLTIPAGSLTLTVDEETVEVPELTFNYSIVAPLVLSWTIDPEEAENLESLGNHFTLNFVDGSVSRIDYTKDLTLTFNGETEMIEAAASEEDDDVNLLEFKTMSLNTAGTKADIYFGKMTDFNYTEEGTYVLTIPAGIFKNNATGEELAEMTFTWVVGDGQTPVEEDQLVEVPAGVELEDWHIEATYYTSQGANDINEPNKVAFDGDDVYVQGLAYYFPEAWVKGTIVNGQAVFASGQFVGEDDNGKEYLNGATVDAENSFVYQDSYVFDYDVEAQKLTLVVDNGYLTECSEKTSISAWGYYSNLEIIKGEAVQPEVVVAPENLVTEDYIFTSQELSFDEETEDPIYEDYEAEIKVGFDGNDVYVQGLCANFYLPEAWVKGEKNGSTVTFTTGQYFGQVNNQYDMFFVGYGESGIEDVVMTYDEATGEFTTDNWIFINGKPNTIYYYTIYTSNKFTKAGSSTAISSINADEQNAVYFDAMGRRTNAQAKGLLIKQVRMADGTVKTVKMASK